MPAEKVVSQFTKSDIFAVLPTGFYIFVVWYAVYAVNFAQLSTVESLWNVLMKLSATMQEKPVMLLFVLFAAYLIGSIFRALPVWWAERITPPFTIGFPYHPMLNEIAGKLNANANATGHDPHRMPNLDKAVSMPVFDYWKSVLCIRSAEGFAYYQTFETRARFFAGMIWAGLVGLVASLYIIIRSFSIGHPTGLPLFFLSLILLATFAYNFRRVRRQEARTLFTIYAACLQEPDRHKVSKADGAAD